LMQANTKFPPEVGLSFGLGAYLLCARLQHLVFCPRKLEKAQQC
jgi:hypothetical protein